MIAAGRKPEGLGAYDREKAYREIYRRFAWMTVLPCPRCGTCDNASAQVGVIGFTIRLAATCVKFRRDGAAVRGGTPVPAADPLKTVG